MLISQKIASSLRFLEVIADTSPLGFSPELVRSDVLRSTKFLVGKHLLNMVKPSQTTTWQTMSKVKTEKDQKQQDDIWRDFSKLPFDLFCIENETGLLLVKRTDSNVLIRWISAEGTLAPIYSLCDFEDMTRQEDIVLEKQVIMPAFFAEDPKHKNTFMTLSTLIHKTVLEILVYLNTSNIKPVFFRPSRRELANISNTFKPFFEYRVVDIYRERTSFRSMGEVESFVNDTNKCLERRAHLVRGHFKKKNGQLFWWNSFMRNRKNIQTDGLIVHDYCVH